MSPYRSKGVIAGVGELKPMRKSEGVTTLELIAEVSRRAVLDAGLEPGAIDGLLVGPQVGETPQHVPATVAEYLGLRPSMANVVDLGGASGAGMVWRAAAAIEAGMCEAVLCVLANTRDENPPRSPNRNPIREFDVPFGASGANIAYALLMQAHMAMHGSTAEDFARIAAWERAVAGKAPRAPARRWREGDPSRRLAGAEPDLRPVEGRHGARLPPIRHRGLRDEPALAL